LQATEGTVHIGSALAGYLGHAPPVSGFISLKERLDHVEEWFRDAEGPSHEDQANCI